ncbi:alpha/beta fold hydrolase [Candidatus Halobonum tyrrellensis]|uniref:Putative hydrolase n=1 Tax=Candidatus Halobonum tyrrellensis G22 TaxID=1324957 RepID=V4HGH7_9EURY|nr:alpha/beta hydrolase [Candidatus Halobonum tyrrellensis]ESP89218.1 putative hydrolase [Candidatus Halobonum tyrrellensis G22]
MRPKSVLKSTLAATAAGAVGTLAATRALRRRAGHLEAPLAGQQEAYRWRGMEVAYAERGEENDETLVFLHGMNAAGSAGEWREVFTDLGEQYHVVAPDFPGFGRSDRPPLRYSAALYEDFVRDFVSEFDDAHVVASSLTAAYVAAVADDLALSGLTLVCPTGTAGPEPPKTWLRELLRAPVAGDAAFGLLTTRAGIRYFNADHGYWDPEKAGDDWSDYEWRTTHQRNAKFAPASFVSGHLNSDIDLGSALAALDAPVTVVWGREADLPPLSAGRDLAETADAELVVFDDAMLLPHVEFGPQFAALVRGDLPDGRSVTVEQESGSEP